MDTAVSGDSITGRVEILHKGKGNSKFIVADKRNNTKKTLELSHLKLFPHKNSYKQKFERRQINCRGMGIHM